jgi:hypothetical protein
LSSLQISTRLESETFMATGIGSIWLRRLADLISPGNGPPGN